MIKNGFRKSWSWALGGFALALLANCLGNAGDGSRGECPPGQVHHGKDCVAVCSLDRDCGFCGECELGMCVPAACREPPHRLVPQGAHESSSDSFRMRGQLTNTGGRATSGSYAVVAPLD